MNLQESVNQSSWHMRESITKQAYKELRKHRNDDWRSFPGPGDKTQPSPRDSGPWAKVSDLEKEEFRVIAASVAAGVIQQLRHDLEDFQSRAKGNVPREPVNWIAAWAIRSGFDVSSPQTSSATAPVDGSDQ